MGALSVLGPNRLNHLDGDLVSRFVAFAESSEHISVEQVIQKLIIFDFVVPILEAHRHDRILEIGSGQGVHSALLSRFGRVSATELVDTVGWMGDAEASRKSVFEVFGQNPIKFAPHAGAEYPYPDESFDIVFHNSVIEHVPDAIEFNREVHRLLDRDGICIAITGTPALCRSRYRQWLARVPKLALRGVLREIAMACVPRLRSRGVVMRLRAAISNPPEISDSSGAAIPTRTPDWRSWYARVNHVLANPKHHRIVLEEMSKEFGMTIDEVLESFAVWFEGSVFRRLALQLTPPTHGEHYRDVKDEEEQWSVDRWIRTFEESGFEVERVFGFRYQQWLEWTGSSFLSSRHYYIATKWIGRRVAQGDPDPEKASEFIMVARKVAPGADA